MSKDKYFLIILLIISFITALVTLIFKSLFLFGIYVTTIFIFFIALLLILGLVYNVKIFKFIIGDFTLSDTTDINKFIYGNSELNVHRAYHAVRIGISIIFLIILGYVSVKNLIITGLSIISIGVALSILTFSYYSNVNEKILLSSAKRFYLATILAILSLISLITIKVTLFPTFTTPVISDYQLTLVCFMMAISAIGVILSAFLLTLTLRYLIEGLIISIKETLILKE